MTQMTVIAMGVHVLDVHVRPTESIPDGNDGQIVEQIRMSPAGTAGGTAVVLARLGATVRSVGKVGDDPIGTTLRGLLSASGVDVSGLVQTDSEQTSASVLPVRPNGDRPAWHCIGANGAFTLEDIDTEAFRDATHLHLGGPEFLGGEAAGKVLAQAHEFGLTTSADLLAPGDPGMLEWVADALPHVDFLLPNDEQLLGLTGCDDLETAARVLLDRGVGCVAVTCGAEGALVVDKDRATRVPAFDVDVVDTTGCGDAFSAGFLRGLSLGLDAEEAAVLGAATAAQVAQGLGTDHGTYDLASVQTFAAETATIRI